MGGIPPPKMYMRKGDWGHQHPIVSKKKNSYFFYTFICVFFLLFIQCIYSILKIQSNFNGSNTIGTMTRCSRNHDKMFETGVVRANECLS